MNRDHHARDDHRRGRHPSRRPRCRRPGRHWRSVGSRVLPRRRARLPAPAGVAGQLRHRHLGRRGGHRELRRRPDPAFAGQGHTRRRGGPAQPPGAPASRQVRSSRRHRGRPGRPVGTGQVRCQDAKRQRGGHSRPARRPLQRPQGPRTSAQPAAQPGLHRAGGAAARVAGPEHLPAGQHPRLVCDPTIAPTS